jgi:Ser/Thr protein kinase RdoA (MazF antagonist)
MATADDRQADAELAEALTQEWLLEPILTPIPAMNSSTWHVESRDKKFILKITTPDQAPGLKTAAWLESHGLPAGAPIRTTVRGGRLIALLKFVDGRPLSGDDPEDVRIIGETLARAHRLLTGCRAPRAMTTWPWVWLDPGLIPEEQLRHAAAAAIRRAERAAPPLTHGILHGDPEPGAFLQSRESVGLIDWGAACQGPLLYDIASAVMYVGWGVVDGYREKPPLTDDELKLVDVFVSFRWAVQAWYFSSRLQRAAPGGSGSAENEKGVADARSALLG